MAFTRISRRNKHFRLKNRVYRSVNHEYYRAKEARQKMIKQVYKKFSYDGKPIVINIDEEFGIEDRNLTDYFFDKAEDIVNFEASSITFDLKNCPRMWPSGVTLLCSLLHWVHMTYKSGHLPKTSSSKPSSDYVNSYLAKCGFYDYVGRRKDTTLVDYDESEMVRLEQEKTKQGIKARCDQLKTIVINQSSLSDDHKELFIDVVLTEVVLNVVEHGVGCGSTMGWWTIAQKHKTHGYISLCVADNGIGIRNSLVSGAQGEYIYDRFSRAVSDEGESIKLAFEKSVSGAVGAPVKEKKKVRKDRYERGAHRGNGLKRVKDACKEMGVSIAVLSHSGYLFIDSKGNYYKVGSRKKKIFAGTLYQFIIPAKGAQQ